MQTSGSLYRVHDGLLRWYHPKSLSGISCLMRRNCFSDMRFSRSKPVKAGGAYVSIFDMRRENQPGCVTDPARERLDDTHSVIDPSFGRVDVTSFSGIWVLDRFVFHANSIASS